MLRNLFFITFLCWQLVLASAVNATAANDDKKAPFINSDLNQNSFYSIVAAEILATSADAAELEKAAAMLFKLAKTTKDERLFERAALASLQSGKHRKTATILDTWQKNYPNTKLQYLIRISLYQATKQPKKLSVPISWLLKNQDSTAERIKVITDLPHLFDGVEDEAQAVTIIKQSLAEYFDTNDEQAMAAWSSLAYAQRKARQYTAMLVSLKHAFDIPVADHTAALRVAAQRLNRSNNSSHQLQQQNIAETWQLLKQHFSSSKIAPLTRLNYAELLLRNERDLNAAGKQLRMIVRLDFPSIDFPRNKQNLTILAQTNFLLASIYANQNKFVLAKSYALTAQHLVDAISDDGENNSEQQLRLWLLLANIEQLSGNFAVANDWISKITAEQRQEYKDLVDNNFNMMAKAAYQYTEFLFLDNPDNSSALEPILLLPTNDLEEKIIKANLISNFYTSTKQYQLAYQSIEQARQELAPNNPELLFKQSILAQYSNNIEQIEPLLKQLLQLEPDNAQALNNLGYHLLSTTERIDEAIGYIEQALKSMPDEPTYLDSLGYAYLKKNQLERAIELLQQAHASQKNPEIAAHLVEALWRNQQPEQAKDIWYEAYQLFPNAAELKAVAQEFFKLTTAN